MSDHVDRYVADNELLLADAGIDRDCKDTDVAIPRAELIFYGVDHKRDSYEGRVFLNRPDADENTPTDLEHGYAGSYWIFGHDRCAGDAGHCNPGWSDAEDVIDLRRPHHAEPQTIAVQITEALHHVAAEHDRVRLTVVAIRADTPSAAEHRPLIHFESVRLVAYGS